MCVAVKKSVKVYKYHHTFSPNTYFFTLFCFPLLVDFYIFANFKTFIFFKKKPPFSRLCRIKNLVNILCLHNVFDSVFTIVIMVRNPTTNVLQPPMRWSSRQYQHQHQHHHQTMVRRRDHTVILVAAMSRKLRSKPMQSLLHDLRTLITTTSSSSSSSSPTSTTTTTPDPPHNDNQQPPSSSSSSSSSSPLFFLSPLLHNATIIEIDEGTMRSPLVHTWPISDVVIPLYSSGFPLRNMLRYVSLRSPLLVNNLHLQPLMQDRRVIRRVLMRAGIPVAKAVVVDRTAGDTVMQSGRNGNTLVVMKKSSSHNNSHNRKKKTTTTTKTVIMEKPFVEKPVDPEDHSKFFVFLHLHVFVRVF